MRLLLDTHAFMWAALAPERLGRQAREALEDLDNQVWASVVNVWEIAVKARLDKLSLLPGDLQRLRAAVDGSTFRPLPVTMDHVFAVSELEQHHRDPFDRILVAQARVERLTLVSHDRQLHRYPVDILW